MLQPQPWDAGDSIRAWVLSKKILLSLPFWRFCQWTSQVISRKTCVGSCTPVMPDHKAVPELGRVDDSERSAMVGAPSLKGLLSFQAWPAGRDLAQVEHLLFCSLIPQELWIIKKSRLIFPQVPAMPPHWREEKQLPLLQRDRNPGQSLLWWPHVYCMQSDRSGHRLEISQKGDVCFQLKIRDWNIPQSGTNVTNSTPCKFSMQQPAAKSRFEIQSRRFLCFISFWSWVKQSSQSIVLTTW